MQIVNVHETKTNLSKMLADVEAGQSFVIARAGKPVAQLVPIVEQEKPKREWGWLADEGTVPDNWKAFGREEIEAMFYGDDNDPA